MASTNKTANLELPQWERTDSVEMEDMNAAFDKLDTVIKETQDSRLRAELLLDLSIPASNLNVISVDVSGIDWTAYKFILVSFPKLRTATVYLNENNTNLGNFMESCYFFCFPAFMGDIQAPFVIVFNYETQVTTARVKFSDIKNLYLKAFGDAKFDVETQIKMWGVK